jgi:phage terminase large subunit
MPSTEVTLPHRWTPRPYQRPLWDYLEKGGKRAIAVWHRRAGKDDVALHWAAVAAMERPATYWHMLPEYSQARKAIWSGVNPHSGRRRIDEAFPHEIRANTSEQEMFIRLRNGSTWQIVGSDNYDSLVGTPPAGIVFSEWARANPASWGYLAPIVVENNGWALFITTPTGRNHAQAMLQMAQTDPTWFAELLTVDDTVAITHEVVEQQRREYHSLFGDDAGDALIEQEYYCSFAAAVLGAFFAKEIGQAERDGRVCSLEINRDLAVHSAWDIGVDDPCAIWCFQVEPGRVNVVDYYESSGQGMAHYVGWLNERGYKGIDVVPQDIKNREFGSGRTRLETLRSMGRSPKIGLATKLMDGIQAARQTIPLCYFDATRCARGLAALREYKAEWDEDLRTFRQTPKHDWASHAADAFRYLALAWRTPIVRVEPEIPPEVRRHEQRFGPTPVARSNADGTVTLTGLETPMAFVQRQARRRKQPGYR